MTVCAGTLALMGADRARADPTTFHVRKVCDEPTLCFDGPRALQDAVTKAAAVPPTAESPVVIDIGPGHYREGAFCNGSGHITFRGAGRDRTLVGDENVLGMVFLNCDGIGVQDLAVTGSLWGVLWVGGGRSTWTNVDITAKAFAWYDGCQTPESAGGVHYLFNARIRSTADFQVNTDGVGYLALCGQSWIYGSDIQVEGSEAAVAQAMVGVDVNSIGDVRVFGSTVRVDARRAQGLPAPVVTGVRVGWTNVNGNRDPAGDGTFHMHGGIVSIGATAIPGAEVSGIDATDQAFAHVVDTAFSLRPGAGGRATRVSGANVQSPFQWPSGMAPPFADFRSNHGADSYIETDCDSTGDCDGAGLETHLMIYNALLCGDADPWFDSTAGQCRSPGS